jgi:hypothetical protein
MHTYQVNDDIRRRVFLLSGVLAIPSARLLSLAVEFLPFKLPWWIEIPSVLGFFGLYIWIYDRYLWNIWPFRKLMWFQIPDLHGKWSAIIKSSYQGFEETTQAVSTIRQTASKLFVGLQTNQSSSYSIYGILMRTERLNTFELIYHYINQPKADATDTMSIHQGTTWLRISEDLQSMEGEYYSGRGRQHFGRISFTRTKEEAVLDNSSSYHEGTKYLVEKKNEKR